MVLATLGYLAVATAAGPQFYHLHWEIRLFLRTPPSMVPAAGRGLQTQEQGVKQREAQKALERGVSYVFPGPCAPYACDNPSQGG